MHNQPIIITCKMDDNAAILFNRVRQQHFPVALNFLEAHLTLFHHILLPAENVLQTVQQLLSGIQRFNLLAERIAFTGRGVGFIIKSRKLVNLHKPCSKDLKLFLHHRMRKRYSRILQFRTKHG